MCQVKSTSISKSATYVVDVRNLRNQDDIKKDEFGIWNYSGSHLQPFKIYYEEDNEITVEKCNPGVTGTLFIFDNYIIHIPLMLTSNVSFAS